MYARKRKGSTQIPYICLCDYQETYYRKHIFVIVMETKHFHTQNGPRKVGAEEQMRKRFR